MDKLEFASRQFSKAENKKYEHYVVTRVWHLLNDIRVKFVTQQFVTRPNGKALTDMYFPQLDIHIEVDEGFHKKQFELDKLREADIINATGHTILRIDVTKNIDVVNKEIDRIITILKNKIEFSIDFKPWDLDAEQSPQTYIDRGYIDLKDDVAFKKIADAINCFGVSYKGYQQGSVKHPKEEDKRIWFPKLYENEGFDNQISDDEMVIYSRRLDKDANREFVNKWINKEKIRIVFARVRSPLGDSMYRFKGEYEIDLDETNHENGFVFRRIATRVETYPNMSNIVTK
jgi:very-short-patch-repair endonuclease